MSRSTVDFNRMSDRQCWGYLDSYLARLVEDPRSAQLMGRQARAQALLARDCLLELRERGTQLQLDVMGYQGSVKR